MRLLLSLDPYYDVDTSVSLAYLALVVTTNLACGLNVNKQRSHRSELADV
jgi:hypothetical protein